MSRLIDENDIIKMLNTMDRYTSEELTLCDTDKTFPMNEVFIVDDVFEGLDELPSAQPEPCEDAVSRKAVYEAMVEKGQRSRRYKLGEIWELNGDEIREALDTVPSAQPDGWLEQNKDKILQAGMEGREIDFRIGGRLFAIREKAQ